MPLIYVARHGETDWNAAQRWQGHTDIPLNENGRVQARALAGVLRQVGLGSVVSSDLARARETATIVAAELGLGVAYTDADLRERNFGCFEGLTREECEQRQPLEWRAWLDQKIAPSGAERQEPLAARMLVAIARVARRAARDDAPVLAVTHGGSLRALVAAVTGELPPPVRNAAVWRLAWDSIEERVVRINEV